MSLRPYQEKLLGELAQAFTRTRRVCAVMPVGAGKTRSGVEFAKRSGKRTLWLAHRIELVQQAIDAFAAADYPATVSTVQSDPSFDGIELVVYDECHRAAAESYTTIQNRYPNAQHLGLTATPERQDGVGLRGAFDEMVCGPTISELIGLGHLVNPRILAPRTKSKHLAMPETDAWLKHCNGRQGFVFTKTVNQSQRVADELTQRGVLAAHIDGSTPPRDRERMVQSFKAGCLKVLTNCAIFTEGFDAPQASACVIARAPNHQGLYLQIVGRVMRTAPGKTDAVVVDLCGVTNELGAPDAERYYSLDGISRKSPEQIAREGRLCPACSRQNETTAETCTRCGFSFLIDDPEVRTRVIQEIRRTRETPDERRAYLARQHSICRARGWNEGRAWHMYRARYGENPPRIR